MVFLSALFVIILACLIRIYCASQDFKRIKTQIPKEEELNTFMIRAITQIWQNLFAENTNKMSSSTTSTSSDSEEDFSHQFRQMKMAQRKSGKKPYHQPEAIKLLHEITGKTERELKTLLFKAQLLPASHENYSKICEYVKNGQEHGGGIQVVHIIRMIRNNDFEFKRRQSSSSSSTSTSSVSSTSGFRMILWHGTKKSCVPAILTTGFAQPPNKQQMFGMGVYFADKASKSANYCDGTTPGKLGYMFLCDVKLGRMFKAKNPHHEYSSPPASYDSVKCVGQNIPDWSLNKEIGGAILPSGKTKVNQRFDSYTVNFNEYVVYDSNRIKPKWLVVVKFQAQKC